MTRSLSMMGTFKRRVGRLLRAMVICLWGLWLMGQYFRDATWFSGLLFYIPSPVLCVCLVACGYGAWRKRQRRAAGVWFLCALVPGFFVVSVENRFGARHPEVSSEDTLRLVHWNVCRGFAAWPDLVDELQRCVPDICVISEIPRRTGDLQLMAKTFGPDYGSQRFGNLGVVARGTLHKGEWLQHNDGVQAYGLVWESPQGPCRVLVVDLHARLALAREPRLLVVRELMIMWAADIVVGDFNAPRRSRALAPLPDNFTHAYDVVGSGISYTWPMACPVYALDQCILGSRIVPWRYTLESSWRSDHRRQILDFTIDKGPIL